MAKVTTVAVPGLGPKLLYRIRQRSHGGDAMVKMIFRTILGALKAYIDELCEKNQVLVQKVEMPDCEHPDAMPDGAVIQRQVQQTRNIVRVAGPDKLPIWDGTFTMFGEPNFIKDIQ